jgi:uncharacterized protein (TIGR03066 family)
MRRASVIVGVLLLGLAGCASNNKGKIVGKWQSTSVPPAMSGASVTLDFRSDGTMTMTVSGPGGSVNLPGKYTLGMGDHVTFDFDRAADLQKGVTKTSERIQIDGGTMTMKDPDGATFTFKRL